MASLYQIPPDTNTILPNPMASINTETFLPNSMAFLDEEISFLNSTAIPEDEPGLPDPMAPPLSPNYTFLLNVLFHDQQDNEILATTHTGNVIHSK